MITGSYGVGLSDLLDQNVSCYEYFYSLPEDLRRKIEKQDIASFEEMQEYVEEQRQNREEA